MLLPEAERGFPNIGMHKRQRVEEYQVSASAKVVRFVALLVPIPLPLTLRAATQF